MRRLVLGITFLMMVFVMNTQTVHASETNKILVDYNAEDFQEIQSYEELVNQAYDCFMNQKGIVAKYYGSDYQTISLDNVVSDSFKINKETIEDNAWLWGNLESYKKGIEVKNGYSIIAIKINYKRTVWEMNQLENYLSNAMEDLDQEYHFKSMKDADKTRIIYDYVRQLYEYDYNYNENAYDTYGAMFLNEHLAVCQAYSLTYYYLCNLVGVKTKIVCSTEENHSLNMNCIDGTWYYVDCTWGDEVKNPDVYFLYSKSAVKVDTSYFFYPNSAFNMAKHNYLPNNDFMFWGVIVVLLVVECSIFGKDILNHKTRMQTA